MNLSRSAGILLHPTSFSSKYEVGDFNRDTYQFVDLLKNMDRYYGKLFYLNQQDMVNLYGIKFQKGL